MPWHVRPILLIALLVACLPATLRADRVADLDSPDYAVRLAATEALLTDESLTPDQLRGWLSSELTLEQRHRLMTVARHVMLRDLVAEHNSTEAQTSIALGFELQPTMIPDPDGRLAQRGDMPQTPITSRVAAVPRFDAELTVEVELPNGQRQLLVRRAGDVGMAGVSTAGLSHAVLVVGTLAGMPAHGRLRAGDLIVALNSRSVHPYVARGGFADLVATFPPGEPVDVDLIREGQTMRITVPTSSFQTLGFLYEGQPATLSASGVSAWRQFLESLAPSASE